MKHLSLLLVSWFLLCFSWFGVAQYNAANVWHFGNNCVLDFNSDPPAAVGGLSFSSLGASEGTSSICDSNGNLLFYSNGLNAWNANGSSFPNFQLWPPASIGIPLLGGGLSATNAACIVPDPGNADQYYLFFAAEEVGFNGYSQQLGLSGISYVKVDMSLDNGLGDLVSDNNVPLNTQMTEKIAVTSVCGSDHVWLVCHAYNSNAFYAYKITDQGIDPPVISNVGYAHDCPIGQMKISPDGTRIACVTYGFFSLTNTMSFEVLEFDNTTGQVGPSVVFDTNFESIPGVNATGLYGLAFSMDGSKVYVGLVDDISQSGPSELYQYDLNLPLDQVVSNRFTLAQFDGFLGQMQLGPDCRLYIANGTPTSLAVIHSPDLPGALCNLEPEGVVFALEEFSNPSLGLPVFNDSKFYPGCMPLEQDQVIAVTDTCVNANTQFQLSHTTSIQDVVWNFDDPQSAENNTSTELAPTHVFTSAGVYTVVVNYTKNCIDFTVERTITIVAGAAPVIAFDFDPLVCNDSTLQVVPTYAAGFDANGSFSTTPPVNINSSTGQWNALGVEPGNYIFTYTLTAASCVATASFTDTVEVISCWPDPTDTLVVDDRNCPLYVPCAFTPDNDGINDVWRVTSACVPEDFSLRVFNRWGIELFQTNDAAFVWTGGVEDYFVPDDVYTYFLRYSPDGLEWREVKGHVVVFR